MIDTHSRRVEPIRIVPAWLPYTCGAIVGFLLGFLVCTSLEGNALPQAHAERDAAKEDAKYCEEATSIAFDLAEIATLQSRRVIQLTGRSIPDVSVKLVREGER